MKKALFYIINFTWCIAQNILGALLLIKYRKCERARFFNHIIVYHNSHWGGVSLGMFVFINGKREEEWIKAVKVHETGHSLQSLILGPLYLFIIGIPSFVWCNAKRYKELRAKTGRSYYDFYCERWANKLGERYTKMPAPK